MFTFLVDGKLHPLAIVPHGGHSGGRLPQIYLTGNTDKNTPHSLDHQHLDSLPNTDSYIIALYACEQLKIKIPH